MSTIYGTLLLEVDIQGKRKSVREWMYDGEIHTDGSEDRCPVVKTEQGTRIDPSFHPNDKPFVFRNARAQSDANQ